MSAQGGCWPTDDQVLLLRAGLLDAVAARSAWERWLTRNTLEAADPGSLRLLPLVYRNLSSAQPDVVELDRLKGAYRASWLRNQLLFKHAAEVLRMLADEGVQTLLLKGIALSVAHYRDDGVRPMGDIDVLVPRSDFPRVLAVLERAGWTTHRDGLPADGLMAVHAQHLHHPEGYWLDLHRYALPEAATDEAFWSASVEIELLGVRTRTLCPADQLLHAAVHGARWNIVPPVRWLADAAVIERSASGGLDWERVVEEAIRRRVTASLVAALEHLVDAVGVPVPQEVLGRLRAAPKIALELWAHRAALGPPGGGSWFPVALDLYARRARVDRTLRLSQFLQESFAASSRRELAGRLARKTAQAVVTQSVARVAPRRVGFCDSCGRVVLSLRPGRSALCEHCAG